MGLQFENLVVHNRKALWNLLNLSPDEIVMDGPFFQNLLSLAISASRPMNLERFIYCSSFGFIINLYLYKINQQNVI